MPPQGFETAVSASEQQLTYALDIATTGTGKRYSCQVLKKLEFS
jgi:hypothetical protein